MLRGRAVRRLAVLAAVGPALVVGFGLARPLTTDSTDSSAVPRSGRHSSESFGDRGSPAWVLGASAEAATAALLPAPPLRVALQAGHWKAQEAPDELRGLRNNGGTTGGGKTEWEVNLEIARLAGALLEDAGYTVDILSATVPQAYRADAFVAIHADGNNDSSVAGYRVGWPRRDATRRASELAEVLADTYGAATGIRYLPVATRRMRGYYAFRYNRYRHAIHPTTVAVIIETGFLTNPGDRAVIVTDPARAAKGIFEGLTRFLGPSTAEALETPPLAPSGGSSAAD